ncbi:MAG: hypothetical protein JWQ00_1064, partial [Noviherbaspirillum sp.]|nr:hypothetical protein [Noviherbaspirillum sp.]
VILKSGMPIDLLFTDVVMPGQLRSPELARQAKLLVPNIEVLFTSGYTQNAIVHGGRLDRGVHLLSKPYRRDQLARKIRELLSSRRPPASSAPPVQTVAVAATSDPQSRKLRILVVEDNADAQEMACEMLALLGHEAEGVSTPAEALALLSQHRFDVLMTDYKLPGMNGVALAELARRDNPALNIVFASGYGEIMKSSQSLDAVILQKPYDVGQLRRAVEQS